MHRSQFTRLPLPPSDADRAAVLKAFRAAERAGMPVVRCYRAAVRVWQARHPDHRDEYASKQAVEIVLASRQKLLRGLT